ncbi:hypothetical protein ACP70R_029202 [Stipagrostis hirtigluma subsp. patula]
MYPANQYMDPYYSHYRCHTPYPYYPPPGWEAGHPRAMDSSYRPPIYGPWSYNAGMHQQHPSEFHCCCNHTYPPGYYSFRPPFPQELPPPHLYYHGPFPQQPGAFPSYAIPQHPFPDQTPYGYDKFKSHCCGCPNHVCHGGDKSNVKIEEERPNVKPDSEQKDADNASIIRHPNSQYPFIWLPSGNMEGKENGKRYEMPPQLLNGWFPMSSNRTGDVKKQEQDNQKEKQFQWPIVWMPAGYDEPKQRVKELKEMDESPKVSEEAPSPKFKIIPLSWFQNGHHDQKSGAEDGSGYHSDRSTDKSHSATTEQGDGAAEEGNHKTTPVVPKRVGNERKSARENYKTIPVVPEKQTDEKVSSYRTIPVMTQKESDEKKLDVSDKKEVKKASTAEKEGDSAKTTHGQSPTAKNSKLPPVCLRVDPLPRKKSGNGSSRSPSPPTRKDGDKVRKDVKEALIQNLEPKQSDPMKNITVSGVKEKSPDEMTEGMGFSNETVQTASVKHSQEHEVTTSKDDQKLQVSSTSVDSQENAGEKNLQGGDNQENAGAVNLQGGEKSTNEDEIIVQSELRKDDDRRCSIKLSEPDAAVRIQSAYRGYDVRRWQPLDKLRKIRSVHEQMQGVKKQLQSLEASSKKLTEREQVAISETIMNLLLKLDTIQGLHPSVREARKSVARELVCLQEKLDTLCKQPSDEFCHTNMEEEKPERAESICEVAPTSTAETPENDKTEQLNEAQEPTSMDSMELHDDVTTSGVSMELRQDADSSDQKHQIEESSTTTREEAPDEGKDAAHVQTQRASSVDMISDAALSGHSTGTDSKQQIEELDAGEIPEQEKATTQEKAQEVPQVDSMEELHDAPAAGDSSALEQYTATTEQNHHTEESDSGVSTAGTEDIIASSAVTSVESGVVMNEDGSAEGQMKETAAIESLELKHDVSPAEEDQQQESSVGHLEDSSVYSKDQEPHELDLTTADGSVMSNTDNQPEEAMGSNMKEQVADATQDSAKEPDGTPEASLDEIELVASPDAEKPVPAPLLEPTLEPDSSLERTVLEESDDAEQRELSGKDDSPHVDQKNVLAVDKLSGGSPQASTKEPDNQEGQPNLAEEAGNTRAETVLPELDECELSCAHEGAITGYESPEVKVSSESQTASQNSSDSRHADVVVSEKDECTEMLREAPVGRMETAAEEVDVRMSETNEANEPQKDVPVCEARADFTEEEADNLKEDVAVQTETKAPEEAFVASAKPGGLKECDEKKLAEENQKLKEMLQKLLASGNEQMSVITDLSEKVKVLEGKLARKKRPKVRVNRQARHATAKVH